MANDATIELSLELDLILGSGEDAVDFILSASIIPGSGFMMFTVTNPSDHDISAAQVFEYLMNGESWEGFIPGPLESALDEIVFQGFSATMFIGEDGHFTLSSISVTIGSNPGQKIKLFGPFNDFAYHFIWTILNPTDEATRTSFANFFAEVDVGDIGTFDIEIVT